MTQSTYPSERPPGRTSWKRLVSALSIAIALVGGLLALAATGGIAMAFTGVSGAGFTLTADNLSGDTLKQYGNFLAVAGTDKPVIEVSLATADLTNMKQKICVGLPVGGQLTAGDNGTPAHAANLIADMTDQTGDITLTNMTLGGPGPLGDPMTTATHINVTNMTQKAFYTTAASLVLNHAHLSFVGCP